MHYGTVHLYVQGKQVHELYMSCLQATHESLVSNVAATCIFTLPNILAASITVMAVKSKEVGAGFRISTYHEAGYTRSSSNL